MLSGGEWRSSRQEPHSRARRSGRLRQEMFGAREKTKPTGYEENTHRIPARPTALLPLCAPPSGNSGERRSVPWHPIPPCFPKKGDTRASSRDPQSILGLPSASFLLLTRHFLERKPFLLNRDRSRAPCDLIRRTVELTRNWRCSRSKSDPVYTDLLQILSHPSTRRLGFVRHGA